MPRPLTLLAAALLPGAGATLFRAHAAAQPLAPASAGRTLRGGWPEECVPEENKLKLERESDGDRGQAVQVANTSSQVSRGDIYLGWLTKCEKGMAQAVRLEVEAWPTSVRLDFFPLAHWNEHNKVFEKPTLNASGGWRAKGEVDKDGGAVFKKGRAGKLGEFGLTARSNGPEMWGELFWPGHEDLSERPRFVPSSVEEYPFFCQEFEAKKCEHAPPRPGEKVVVFMRHGSASCNVDGTDPILDHFGEDQVRERMFDPNLAKVMSNDPADRAQVIVMSPLARAMHTALLVFGKKLPDIKWEIDPNLVELGGVGSVRPGAGERLLRNFSATALLEQYRTLTEMVKKEREAPHHHHHGEHHSHADKLTLQRKEGLDQSWLENVRKALEAEPPRATALGSDLGVIGVEEDQDGPELEERFGRFTMNLLERPETRFIAVSHKHLLKGGIDVPLDQTQTVVMALSRDQGWRRVAQPPHCWPGFHT